MARKGKDNEGEISDVEFENIPGTDDYIEFLGEVDDEFGHLPRTDDYVDKLGEVHDKSQVDDIGGIEAIQLNHHDGHDSDSDDDSYMEHLESGSECRDSEESLIDDDEMHEDPEDRSSDEDEDRSSDEDEFNSNAPPQERVKRRESDGSEKRTSFRAGSAPSVERISRKGTVMKCSFCRTAGHNRSTCKEAPPSNNRHPGRKKNHLQSSQVESSSVILPCTPDASTQQTSTPAKSGNQSSGLNRQVGRTRFYKPVRPFGFGVMVDEDSGRSVYNPGLRTEKELVAPYHTSYSRDRNNWLLQDVLLRDQIGINFPNG
ncbi:hypothetical protein K1719_000365 [Acacia pycnantha]|nr:hypothetical protein K1719_000365 [Acacia pycnantha]